jgi:hypothetical protein
MGGSPRKSLKTSSDSRPIPTGRQGNPWRWLTAGLNVRTDLGLPSGRAAYGRLAPLREVVTQLMAAGLTDAAIAAEFNARGVRGFLVAPPWTVKKVRHLRHRLRIIRRRWPPTTTGSPSGETKEAE